MLNDMAKAVIRKHQNPISKRLFWDIPKGFKKRKKSSGNPKERH